MTEELFEQVQFVASGKKMMKAKPKKVNEALPMRGYLICSSCGTNLTGSASKGNGGTYYYYHCQPGCKERHKANIMHDNFSAWLGNISIEPEVAELYMAIVQDIFKTEEGDRDKEIKRIENAISEKQSLLNKSVEKLISGDLDKWGYHSFKENTSKAIFELKQQHKQIEETDSALGAYIRYGFSLLSNMQHYYDRAELQGKQKFLGLIFPEKLVFEDGKYRTNEPNDILSLICSSSKAFGVSGERKSTEKGSGFCMVAPTRIELVSKV